MKSIFQIPNVPKNQWSKSLNRFFLVTHLIIIFNILFIAAILLGLHFFIPSFHEGISSFFHDKYFPVILLIFIAAGSYGIFIYYTIRLHYYANREKEEKDERLAFASLGGNDGLWDWDIEKGEVFTLPCWNEKTTIFSKETFSYDEWLNRVHPNDIDFLKKAISKHLETKQDHFEYEYRIKNIKNNYIWAQVRAISIRNTKGEIFRLVGSLKDISEKKDSEIALKESESHLRAILETTADGIITIDDRGLIVSFNPAASKLFGYTKTEIIGEKINILMPSPFKELHDLYIANFIENKSKRLLTKKREIIGLQKNGKQFPIEVSLSEVEIGKRRFFTGILRDISIRKNMEEDIHRLSSRIMDIQEKERNRIANELHDEMGQSLAALKLHIQSAFRNPATAKDKHEKDILTLLNEIIRNTRFISHNLSPMHLNNLGLESALYKLTDTFNRSMVFKVKLEIESMKNEFPKKWEIHIYRVVQEALVNIIKHAKAKSVLISIQKTPNVIEVKIIDDGSGIKSKKDLSNSEGIGLLTMKERARLMNGNLTINSEYTKGTEVYLELPRKHI